METIDPSAVRKRTVNELAMILFRRTHPESYASCMQIAEDLVKLIEGGEVTYLTLREQPNNNSELSYEDFCDAYDDHFQFRDWTSLDYLCDRYPHHDERRRRMTDEPG